MKLNLIGFKFQNSVRPQGEIHYASVPQRESVNTGVEYWNTGIVEWGFH